MILLLIIALVTKTGLATHYGFGWNHERHGGSGIYIDVGAPLVAHKTLPYGTIIKITNINEKSPGYKNSVKAIVFDHGPKAKSRIVDMMPLQLRQGLCRWKCDGVRVEIEVLDTSHQCTKYLCLRAKFGKYLEEKEAKEIGLNWYKR